MPFGIAQNFCALPERKTQMRVFLTLISLTSFAKAFQSGVSFLVTNGVTFDAPGADQSMNNYAKQTNAKWIAIVTSWYQTNVNSTVIAPDHTTSGQSIVHAIKHAKRQGLKVMLKPHVDLSNDPSHWRGEIGMYFNQSQWDTWFVSYTFFITRFAQIARNNGVDQLCIGTELSATQGQTAKWTAVIAGLRKALGMSTQLVYAANHGDDASMIPVWSGKLLDFIGVDAYFPIIQSAGGWKPWSSILSQISTTYQKKISLDNRNKIVVIFTEIGYCSMVNANIAPWNCTVGQLDIIGQANNYQAVFDNLLSQSWFQGIYWWDWGSDPKDGGLTDTGYTPQGKNATQVLSKYYSMLHSFSL